jgi:hypothetical protein
LCKILPSATFINLFEQVFNEDITLLELVITPTIIIAALIISGLISKKYIEEMIFGYINDLKGEVIEIAPQLVEQFGDTIITKFKASLMGMKSGKVRGEKATQKKLISEVIQHQNPLVSMFIDRIPELKDMLAENPEALMQLLPLAQKFLGGSGSIDSQTRSFVNPQSPPSNYQNNPYWRCV